MQHFWVDQSYLCSVASIIFSLSHQFDRHSHVHRHCQLHPFACCTQQYSWADWFLCNLVGSSPNVSLVVRKICTDIRKNYYWSVVIPCHTRFTTSLVVHLHSSAFFAFDVFFVDFQIFSRTICSDCSGCSHSMLL